MLRLNFTVRLVEVVVITNYHNILRICNTMNNAAYNYSTDNTLRLALHDNADTSWEILSALDIWRRLLVHLDHHKRILYPLA